MEIAKVIEYSIRTRIIVDCSDGDDQIIRKANNKILCDPAGYIAGDNIVIIEDDDEEPYDPEYDSPESEATHVEK